MLEKLLNSKFIQKLKTIKHIEVIIVVLFILLLLVIYFVNFGEKKDKTINTSTNLNTTMQNSLNNSLLEPNNEGFVNITQNYKAGVEKELNTLIFNSTNNNIIVNILLGGGEILYSLETNDITNFSNSDISITVSGGAIIVNYTPEIEKVILSATQNLNVQEKLIITDLIKNYLNVSSNKIFFY